MTDAPQDSPKVIMLPPILVMLHIAAGLTLNYFGHGSGWWAAR